MKCRLRGITREDLATVSKWHSDTGWLKMVIPGPILPEPAPDLDLWINAIRSDRANYIFAIEDQHGTFVGISELQNVDWKNRSAELGLEIGDPSNWGQGIGYDAALATLRCAFGELGLHRIYGRVLSSNARALRVAEKLGFVHEGCFRQAVYRDGHYQDVILISLLETEFTGGWSNYDN